MNIVDIAVLVFLFVSFPIGIYIFSGKRVTWDGVLKLCSKYEYHFYLLIFIFVVKTVVLFLEEPVESLYAIDFTQMIHDVEGNHVFWIQHRLLHPWMTVSMISVYVGSFMFIFVFSFLLFAYLGRFKIASDLVFLNWVLLLLTIPFYLLVVVYVPSYPKMFFPGSQSIVMGMEPLLYNYSPSMNEFFTVYDTFNNCFPSMHIGYPCAILILLARQVKGFFRYKLFLFIMLILISTAILYLGIHWILDIFGGVAIAFVGVALTEKFSRPFWKRTYKIIHKIERFRKEKGLNLFAGLGNDDP